MLDSGFFVKLFAKAVKVAEKLDLPLYCGEYGVIDRADPESTLNWFRMINEAFEQLHIARAAWSYKEMDFDLRADRLKPVFDELKKYF